MESSHLEIHDEEPKTVYKFRDWNNNFHRSILIHNKIYLPSPKELNDPFDFQIKSNFDLLNTDEKNEKFIDYLVGGYVANNPKAYHDLSALFNLKDKMKLRLKNERESVSLEFNQRILNAYFNHLAVFCVSKIWNNILMWSHYANNHFGICIGFNNLKLRELFKGECTHVNYNKDYPNINPLDWLELNIESRVKEIYTKSIDWDYEGEYRFVKVWFPEIPIKQDRMFQFDDSHIDEIILGLNISFDNEKEIQKICNSRNIPVYKIIKSDTQFILEREKL